MEHDDAGHPWRPTGVSWVRWESRSLRFNQQPTYWDDHTCHMSQHVNIGGCYPRPGCRREWSEPSSKQLVECQDTQTVHHDVSSTTCGSATSQEDAASEADATSSEQQSSITAPPTLSPPPPFSPPPPPPPQRVPGTLTFGYDDALNLFVVRWTLGAAALAGNAPLASPPFGLARSAGGLDVPAKAFTMELHRVVAPVCTTGRVQLRCHSAAAGALDFAIMVGETKRAPSAHARKPAPHDFAELPFSLLSEAEEWDLEAATAGGRGGEPRTLAVRLLVSQRPSRI